MNKKVCDFDGTVPAFEYQWIKSGAGLILSIDLCDKCASNFLLDIEGKMKLTDVTPVLKP